MGIREERKAATLKGIQQAALDLIETQGLEKTTISQIAARAGIADRTFFRYCDSKESAVLPRQHELIEAMVACEIAEGTGAAEIFRLLVATCRRSFEREIRGNDFRRVSRLLVAEPRLLPLVTRHEQELASTVGGDLVNRGLLDRVPALLLGELLASCWRVAWQCFGFEEREGNLSNPVELFDRTVAALAVLVAAPVE